MELDRTIVDAGVVDTLALVASSLLIAWLLRRLICIRSTSQATKQPHDIDVVPETPSTPTVVKAAETMPAIEAAAVTLPPLSPDEAKAVASNGDIVCRPYAVPQ